MTKSICHITSLTIVLITATLLMTADHSQGFTGDRILATVDDEVITLSDYQLFARVNGITADKDAVDEELLRKLMDEKVILHEAKRRGIEIRDAEAKTMIEEFRKTNAVSEEDFEKELAGDGMSRASYEKFLKDKMLGLKLVGMDVDSKVHVTDKDVEEFYHTNRRHYLSDSGRAEVKAIFLRLSDNATVTEITDLKRKALKIAAQLKEGDSFEMLLHQYGDEYQKDKEGKLGEFEKGTLIQALDRKVFSLKAGEISEPIWVREGVYIVKLMGRTEEKIKPLEDVREEIFRHLQRQQKEKFYNEWMKTLWERSSTRIN